jgi:hypothetical protein
MKARSFPARNDSAVSSRLDRHKTHCFGRRWSTPSDPPPAGAQNRIRAGRRSVYKNADTIGTQCAHPVASSTSLPAVASAKVGAQDNQIVSALRPFAPILSLMTHRLHVLAKSTTTQNGVHCGLGWNRARRVGKTPRSEIPRVRRAKSYTKLRQQRGCGN